MTYKRFAIFNKWFKCMFSNVALRCTFLLVSHLPKVATKKNINWTEVLVHLTLLSEHLFQKRVKIIHLVTLNNFVPKTLLKNDLPQNISNMDILTNKKSNSTNVNYDVILPFR